MYIGIRVKYQIFSSDFNETTQISIFTKICPVRAQLYPADRHDAVKSLFAILRTRLKWFLYDWGLKSFWMWHRTAKCSPTFLRNLTSCIIYVHNEWQLSDMYGVTSQGTLFFLENKAAITNMCCFQQITTMSKQQSVSWEADRKFSTFHGIFTFITLFNQIQMHPHHLKMVPFNTILQIPLDFQIISLQDSLPVWPIIIHKILGFF